ncbi:MAG: hypothetical protein WC718_01360 [Phycisphaerales bacterium]|jgi:hypothetical protein
MGAISAAAAEAVAEGEYDTVKGFTTAAYELVGEWEPDWSLFRPRQYQHAPPGLPLIPSQDHVVEDDPEGDPMHVAVIGDAHDSPHLRDKSRFRWLGAYIEERGLERVVSVGDWMTMDCFSSHSDRATFSGFAKPTFDQEIDSFHESQRAFQDGLGGHKPKKFITFGNHENRARTYDDYHPDGISHWMKVEEAFAQWGWRTRLYGEYLFLSGVGFVHVPLNGRGKPMTQNQQPNKAMCDTVHGDDHRATQMTDFKSGPFRSPTIYSAATALPPGFIEGFANKGGSTWRTGICEATLWGAVRRWSFEEMILLKRRYGRQGEDANRTMSGWAA